MYSSNTAPLAPSSEEMERRATRSSRLTIASALGFGIGGLYSYWETKGGVVGFGACLSGLLASGVVGAVAVRRSYDPLTYSHTAPEIIDTSSQVRLSASNSNR